MRKDIDLSFTKHPLTNDLSVKKGSNAIAQSLENIVLTNFYERGFNIEFGTNTTWSLFELMDNLTIQTLKNTIKQSVKNFEPDVELTDVIVEAIKEENILNISLFYTEYNDPRERTTTIDLTRLR